MTVVLRIGWVMTVMLTIAAGIRYASEGHQVRALALGIVLAALLVLRRDITEQQ